MNGHKDIMQTETAIVKHCNGCGKPQTNIGWCESCIARINEHNQEMKDNPIIYLEPWDPILECMNNY